jgi:hypothetical protein
MPSSFFEQPVLNSPYAAPRYHHALDEHGQPLDVSPPLNWQDRGEGDQPLRRRSDEGV